MEWIREAIKEGKIKNFRYSYSQYTSKITKGEENWLDFDNATMEEIINYMEENKISNFSISTDIT